MLIVIILALGIATWIISDMTFNDYGYVAGNHIALEDEPRDVT